MEATNASEIGFVSQEPTSHYAHRAVLRQERDITLSVQAAKSYGGVAISVATTTLGTSFEVSTAVARLFAAELIKAADARDAEIAKA